MRARVERVYEQELAIKAIVKRDGDPDMAILNEPPPEFELSLPEELVYTEWLEWKDSRRFYDSDLPPEYRDSELRENVLNYDFAWRYEMAKLKESE